MEWRNNMKWYDVKLSDVTIIGEFPYFEDTDEVQICSLGFGKYKGIQVKKRYNSNVYNGETYKTKLEAIEKAKRNYASNPVFVEGLIPFEIVFYLKGIGWQIFSSNTIENEMNVKKKLELPVPWCWQ